tara:strand:+ start:3474 stop:3746 length:273 start_codon:yes stop_codon:yes gene_type:complete
MSEYSKSNIPNIDRVEALVVYDNGVHGCVLKTDPDHTILECLQRVAGGDHYVSATLGHQLDMQLPVELKKYAIRHSVDVHNVKVTFGIQC